MRLTLEDKDLHLDRHEDELVELENRMLERIQTMNDLRKAQIADQRRARELMRNIQRLMQGR